MYELIYTSAKRGLKVGSRGFCTVAHTEGMPANLIQLAESLSGYRNLYQPHDRNYARNPLAFSHYLADVAGRNVSVLSRVAAYGTDYSGRTNKLAHHLLLENSDRSAVGPAVVLSQPALFADEWKDEPRLLSPGRRLQVGDASSFRADTWQTVCGDAGWAGVLAQRHHDAPGKDTYLVFEPGMDLLPLMREALALLPPAERWQVTFSTYFGGAPRHSSCHWRGCVKGADAVRAARGRKDVLVIDLTAPMPRAAEGPLVAVARGDATPEWAAPPKPSTPASRRKPSVRRGRPGGPAESIPEPGSVRLRGADPIKKRPIELARRHQGDGGGRKPVTAKPGMGGIIGIVAGVIVIVVGAICIWHMGPSRRLRQKVPPPPPRAVIVKPGTPAVSHRPEPPVAAAPDRATNAAVPVVPADVPPRETPTAVVREEVHRSCDVRFEMRTFAGAAAPWHAALPGDAPWTTYDYEFIGEDGPFVTGDPVRDVDRLRNVVRALVYRIDSVGLRAGVTGAGIDFTPLPGTAARSALLTCVRVVQPDRERDTVVWLSSLNRACRGVEDIADGVVFPVAREGAVAILEEALVSGEMRCQAGFDGTELRHDLPYEAAANGDVLELTVTVGAERERILNVIRWQAQTEKKEKAAPPREVRVVPVWDRARVEKALSVMRKQAGESGTMTSVRRKVLVRDLRALLADYCEPRLEGAAAEYASAPRAHHAMEDLKTKIRDVLWKQEDVGEDDEEDEGNGDDADDEEVSDFQERVTPPVAAIRTQAGERAHFYRRFLLPSNRLLSNAKLRDILFAEEWDAVLAGDNERDFPPVEEEEDDNEVFAVLTVTDIRLYPSDAAYQPVLTVRRADVGTP